MPTPQTEPPPTPTPSTSAWLPVGQAIAEVIEHAFLVYLKDKREIDFISRAMSAFSGSMLLYMSVLFQQYSSHLQDRTETNMDAVSQLGILESLVPQDLLAYFGATAPMAGIVALVIAYGINHGGPLRFFFAGVTVPALVFFIASRLG